MTEKNETKRAGEEKGKVEVAPKPASKPRARKPRAKSTTKAKSKPAYEVIEEESIRGGDRIEGKRLNILIMEKRKAPSGHSSLFFTPEGCDYITELASYGSTMEEICENIGVSFDTARNRNNTKMFEEAYRKGKTLFLNGIRNHQNVIMRRGSAAMAIFLGKNYLGQRDNPKDEVVLDANSPLGQFVLQIGAQQKKSAERNPDETEKASE